MTDIHDKSAARIEHEIDQDRQRIEEKLNAIQSRLTPGQMIDEALGYMKSHGGAEYFANLGRSAKANPIPLALMGVSLAWLMSTSGDTQNGAAIRETDRRLDDTDYPFATVTGSVRRAGPVYSEGGKSYSDFVDSTGKRFKALTDETGRRAGHFMDEAGQYFRGFVDSTGSRISDIRDEAGTLFDDASGWVGDTWRAASESLRAMGESISDTASRLGRSSSSAAARLQNRSSQFSDMLYHQFRDQPLVAGALAFAAGAALGAALPHTRHEDELMGETADRLRDQASTQAADMMRQGEEVAQDLAKKAAAVASDVHDAAREKISEQAESYAWRADGNGQHRAH